MSIERRQRSPLGVCYRTALDVFGPGQPEPPVAGVQVDPAAPIINPNQYQVITSDCRLIVSTLGPITVGNVRQDLFIDSADHFAYTPAQWLAATYSQGGLSYDLSALTVVGCTQVEPPPFGQFDRIRYVGLLSAPSGSNTAYDLVAYVSQRQSTGANEVVTLVWNNGEWPATFLGDFDSNQPVDVTFP